MKKQGTKTAYIYIHKNTVSNSFIVFFSGTNIIHYRSHHKWIKRVIIMLSFPCAFKCPKNAIPIQRQIQVTREGHVQRKVFRQQSKFNSISIVCTFYQQFGCKLLIHFDGCYFYRIGKWVCYTAYATFRNRNLVHMSDFFNVFKTFALLRALIAHDFFSKKIKFFCKREKNNKCMPRGF